MEKIMEIGKIKKACLERKKSRGDIAKWIK
jgi:hypothetical protein